MTEVQYLSQNTKLNFQFKSRIFETYIDESSILVKRHIFEFKCNYNVNQYFLKWSMTSRTRSHKLMRRF